MIELELQLKRGSGSGDKTTGGGSISFLKDPSH
jgi:hypothetical protein